MRKLGLIVFGAGTYDYHAELNNPRFAKSASEFKKTIVEDKILGKSTTETLDLYDQSLSVSETYDKVLDFVDRDFDDIITFYCGHGDVGLRDGDYGVFLRTSNRDRRHSLLNFHTLTKSAQRVAHRKRIYFVIDACYSASAIPEGETMDVGGAEALVDRRLLDAVRESGSGTAILAASGRFGPALAKTEDQLTLFTGAFTRCLKEGIANKKDALAFSWLDIKDEIVRVTQDRLGPHAPIPKLASYSDSASDIARTPFFSNRAYAPSRDDGKAGLWEAVDDRVTEHLYWKNVSHDSPVFVLEDFLAKFPGGIFSTPARAFLLKQVDAMDENALEEYLLDHPRSAVLDKIEQRLASLNWNRLGDSADIDLLEKFVQRFPRNEFARDVRLRIDSVRALKAHDITPLHAAAALRTQNDAPERSIRKQGGTEPKAGVSFSNVPAVSIVPQSLRSSDSRSFASRYSVLLVAAILILLAAMIGSYYNNADLSFQASMRDLDAAGFEADQVQGFVNQCRASACPVLGEATKRLALVQATAEPAVRERTFRDNLADTKDDDVPALQRIVDECRKISCAVLNDANQRLSKAQITADAAAREKKFRDNLAATKDNDVPALQRIADECRKVSCAVLNDANQRLGKAQTAADAVARERKFRDDLVDLASDDVPGLERLVDECRKAICAVQFFAEQRLAEAKTAAQAAHERKFHDDLAATKDDDVPALQRIADECRKVLCAVLNDANKRLSKAQIAADAAAREKKFRDDLAATKDDDISGLQWIVDECRKALCAVQTLAEQRVAEAKAAADAADRQRKFNSDLAASGNDIARLRGMEDECSKANCANLAEISHRLADARSTIEAAAREQQFRKDLSATKEDDLPRLKQIVDECRKASCAVLYDASRLLAKAQAAASPAVMK